MTDTRWQSIHPSWADTDEVQVTLSLRLKDSPLQCAFRCLDFIACNPKIRLGFRVKGLDGQLIGDTTDPRVYECLYEFAGILGRTHFHRFSEKNRATLEMVLKVMDELTGFKEPQP